MKKAVLYSLSLLLIYLTVFIHEILINRGTPVREIVFCGLLLLPLALALLADKQAETKRRSSGK